MKLLDCTIRDGGYYTEWDFDSDTVHDYLDLVSKLPLDYCEVGYLGLNKDKYFGQYRYCNNSLLKGIKKSHPRLKLAVMIDLKEVNSKESIEPLLSSVEPYIRLIRVAADPMKFRDSVELIKTLCKYDFDVAVNLMYLSKLEINKVFIDSLKLLEDHVRYIYLVDSYGSCSPREVREKITALRNEIKIELGFHGHNNLELALANTLAAIESGASIVDSTVLGMGRGAGNLKTELILSYLSGEQGLNVDFDSLLRLTDIFGTLHKKYNWGTSLPYMFSGVNSLPQANVMTWMAKRRYNFADVIRKLELEQSQKADNLVLPSIDRISSKGLLIIGGGDSVLKHKSAITNFANKADVHVLFTSSKTILTGLLNKGWFITSGKEIYDFENLTDEVQENIERIIYPASPRFMGTYIIPKFKKISYEVKYDSIEKIEFKDSPLLIALQIAFNQKDLSDIYLAGFDGFINSKENGSIELHVETQSIIDKAKRSGLNLVSITKSTYSNLKEVSVYSFV